MPTFRSKNFELTGGDRLAEIEIAYDCYGEFSDLADNVILVCHGLTSSHHAAGEVTADRRRGWWDEVIGPGKLFDTRHYCIVSSNTLGSCYGSTGPASIDPATGRPYGATFPAITLEDIVKAQHLLLRSLGIEQLVAVAGGSIGGFQAFQWAVSFPDFMKGIIATDTGPKDRFDSASTAASLVEGFSRDPNWNGGHYHVTGSLEEALTRLRIGTLRSYGFEEKIDGLDDPAACEAYLLESARAWAQEFDAHALVALDWAKSTFDVEAELQEVRAKFLYVLADTDELFPASIGKDVVARLEAAGVDVTYLEIQSRLGHYATIEEPEKWVPTAGRFLAGLDG